MGDTVLLRQQPTLEQIRSWPAACSIPKASAAFGFSPAHGYELAQRGEFPARVIRAGGRLIVVTADLLRLLEGAHTGGGSDEAA